MLIVLYNFTKKSNSTLEPNPNNSASTTLSNVEIKEGCSFLYPTLIISPNPIPDQVFSPTQYNYVSIPYWMRYYFIKDWRWVNGVWEVDLSVDVLASFKSSIGDTDAYIIRSASQYNGAIVDSFYPTTSVCAITKQQISSDIYHTTVNGGCFVVGVINNSSSTNKMGAVIYYALTPTQMKNLLSYMFSDNIYWESNIEEIGEGLYKALFNPFQYIVSCMWFPYGANTLGSGTEKVKVGYWETSVNNAVIVNGVVQEFGFKTALPIERHPQISRGSYLDHAPYTRLTAYYPPFGEIPIDTTYMQYDEDNYLYGKIYVDHVTGIADCYLTITNGYGSSADPYKFMTMRTAQIGVPIQISQVLADYVSTVGSAGGMISSGFNGSIAGVFGNIMSFVSSTMPKVSSLGANGSLLEIIEPPYLIVEHFQLVDENRTEFGRPLCATRRISQLSGYIKCGQADHAFPCTEEERKQINQYMQDGFFFE